MYPKGRIENNSNRFGAPAKQGHTIKGKLHAPGSCVTLRPKKASSLLEEDRRIDKAVDDLLRACHYDTRLVAEAMGDIAKWMHETAVTVAK